MYTVFWNLDNCKYNFTSTFKELTSENRFPALFYERVYYKIKKIIIILQQFLAENL
jgi:hypothetical protein